MSRTRIDDGLNKWQRHRLKDLEAYRKKKREYARTPAERAKRNIYMQKWKEKNRERVNELARQSHHRNKHKHRNRNRDYALRLAYGISLDTKIMMLEAQNQCCAICSRVLDNTRTAHVDHCHITKKVRGILCHVCNTKLAWYESYGPQIVMYLKKHSAVG